MRSLLRWLARLGTGVLALVVVAAAIALVLAHTGWGREQLRARIEAELRDAFPGGARNAARIERLDGSVLGTVTLHGVAFGGADGVHGTIETVEVELALWPLMSRTARIDRLVADGVRLVVRSGPEAAAASPAGAAAPSPWRIELPQVELHRAALVIEAGGTTQTLGELEVAAAGTIDRGQVALSSWSHGRWQEGAVALTISATARAVSPATTQLEVAARGDGARLWASLRGEPARGTARGVISVVGVDVARVTNDRLRGRGDLLAAIDAGADRVRGTVLVHGDLRATQQRLAVQDAVVAIDVARSAAIRDAGALVFAGGDDLGVVATGRTHGWPDGAIVLDDGYAVATATAVDVDGRHVTGARLQVDAAARGALVPAPDLTVAGSAAGDRVALDDTVIAALRGPFTLHAAAGGITAETRLTARGVRSGDTAIGAIDAHLVRHRDGGYRVDATARPRAGVEIAAGAQVTAGGAGIVAEIDGTRVTLPSGARWTGRGGRLVIDDDTAALRGVALQDGDARVVLGGALVRTTGELTARVDADRVSASMIDPRYRGRARGSLVLGRRGGAWRGDAQLALSGFAVAPGEGAPPGDPSGQPPGDPIDATAHAVLAGRRVTLALQAGSLEHGVELAVDATAPRDPFDLGAWQRLELRAIRDASVTAHDVALPALADVIGIDRGALTGAIDGTAHLAPDDVRGAFTVRGVELPFATTGAEVALAAEDGDLAAHATAQLPGLAGATLDARLALPEQPFDPAAWRRARELVRSASARLDDVALDDAPERRPLVQWLAGRGIALPVHGRARVALTVGAAARDAQLAIDADAAGGPLAAPVASHVDVTAGARGTHVHAALRELGVVDGDLPVTLDRWLAQPAAALRSPVVAQWTLPAVPAAPLLALVGRRDVTAGTLEGSAAIRGTLATPIADAHLVARDITVAPRLAGRTPPAFRELEVTAAWGGASGHLEVRGDQAGGGDLHVVASGRPDQLAGVTGSITARRLDVALLAAIASRAAPGSPDALAAAAGSVDADLALRAGGRVAGTARLTGGALPIAATIGTLHDATADIKIDEGGVKANLTGKLGGGAVQLEARAPTDLSKITATLVLDRVSPIVAMRPIVSAKLSAGLQVGEARCGDHGGARVCGKVTVEPDARITFPDQADTPLLDPALPGDLILVGAERSRDASAATADRDAAPARPAPRSASAPWLVAAVDLPQVTVEANDVAEGNGFQGMLRSDDLVVSLGDAVSVSGNVEIDNADADLLGRHYQVDRGELHFNGSIDPGLELTLSHAFPELTLFVAVTELASKPKLEFSSDPSSYTPDQLFGFFLGGEPGGDPSTQAREAVAGGLARAVSGRLGRRIGKELPIQLDTVSCEPATSATAATGASCTFGKWVSRRVYLTYRQRLGTVAPDENTGEVQVQVRVGNQTVLEGTGGDRGNLGADVLWRQRW